MTRITKHSRSGPRSRSVHFYIPSEDERLLKALSEEFAKAHGATVGQSLIVRSALWRLAHAVKSGERPYLPLTGKTMRREEKDVSA
jgi:hypothetical protein